MNSAAPAKVALCEPSRSQGRRNSQCRARADQHEHLSHDQPLNLRASGSERHTQPDFADATRHRVGDLVISRTQ
jgi:hypothetical protein